MPVRVLLPAILLLPAACWAATEVQATPARSSEGSLLFPQGAAGGHDAPAARIVPKEQESEYQRILTEMWQRKVLGPDMNQWSSGDMRSLLRIREAESRGVIQRLKRRTGTLDGFAVEAKLPGAARRRLILTKEGFDRWLFLTSQDAIAYFEGKGVHAKWIFRLADTEGRPLFIEGGLLTEEGQKVYRRATLGLRSFWVLPSGEIIGTRRPPRPKAGPAEVQAAPAGSSQGAAVTPEAAGFETGKTP